MQQKQLVSSSILTLLLLLGGCDQGEQTTQQTPAAQSTSNRYLITGMSAGPVQLGMNMNEVLIALPEATSDSAQDGEGINWVDIKMHDETVMSLLLDENDHTVSLIRVFSPEYATDLGVHVGENLQSVADKLGGLNEIQSTEIESREFATFKNSPSGVEFQVVGGDGTAGVYSNSETISTIASPTATIQSIWIVED